MDPRSQKVFDPMFAGRTRQQQSLPYVRRQAQYFSSKRLLYNEQPPVEPQVIDVPQPAAYASQATSEPEPEVPVSAPRRLWRLPSFPAQSRQSILLYAMAAVVFIAGLVVTLNGMQENHVVAAQVTHLQQQTTQAANNVVSSPHSGVVPSAVKPSPAKVASYTVSPNEPRYISIPAIGANAEVLSEGVSSSNQLQVPWNIYDTGWYNASSQPGQPGAMLIDGHSGIDGMHGIFYRLGSLVNGDQIVVTRGDGQKFTYTVVKVQIVNANSVNMKSMVVSANPNFPGLNLITCTGEQIPGTDLLNERVQVYATMQ